MGRAAAPGLGAQWLAQLVARRVRPGSSRIDGDTIQVLLVLCVPVSFCLCCLNCYCIVKHCILDCIFGASPSPAAPGPPKTTGYEVQLGGMVSEKWMVLTMDSGLAHYSQFDTQEEAQKFFNSQTFWLPRILYEPMKNGGDVKHKEVRANGGNPRSRDFLRSWSVKETEGLAPGGVKYLVTLRRWDMQSWYFTTANKYPRYYFMDRADAEDFMRKFEWCPTVLHSAGGGDPNAMEELGHSGCYPGLRREAMVPSRAAAGSSRAQQSSAASAGSSGAQQPSQASAGARPPSGSSLGDGRGGPAARTA